MQNGAMKAWLDSSYLTGANQSYIEQLYEDFLTDPGSVEDSWRSIFQQFTSGGTKSDHLHSKIRDYFGSLAKDTTGYNTTNTDPETDAKQVKVLQLINAFRFRGHQHANLDPLGLWQQEKVSDLDPAYHKLTEADFQETFNVGSFAIGKETMKLGDLYAALKRPTAVRLVQSTCTSPIPKRNAGSSNSSNRWWGTLALPAMRNAVS